MTTISRDDGAVCHITSEPDTDLNLQSLCKQLETLTTELTQETQHALQEWQPWLSRCEFMESAENLAAYLALRRRNLWTLQKELSSYGVGNFSFIEEHVLPSLHLIQQALHAQAGLAVASSSEAREQLRLGHERLKRNAVQLFGQRPPNSEAIPDIMVTFPSEAATDAQLVYDLLAAGMTIARINAAHDSALEWAAMLENLRAAEKALGKTCRVHIDLAGPKVRTHNVKMPKGVKKKGMSKDPQRLYRGDTVLLAGEDAQAAYVMNDHLPCVTCTLTQAITQVSQGQQVWFDDGKIGTVVEQITPHGLLLRVTHARDKGEKLKDEKGINFPETTLAMPALTNKDIQDLAFAVSHADTVGYSFVQTVQDVELLLSHMEQLGAGTNLGIILKIETRAAVSNIAALIVRTAGVRPCGVMIARGDLAVELGFGRLTEVQEELLWVCAAAQVPVVWATQVLESLVKKGTPSRGEFTDAAMGIRAEAVMLNKGPYIVCGVQELRSVLSRMRTHQHKDQPQYRSLNIARP